MGGPCFEPCFEQDIKLDNLQRSVAEQEPREHLSAVRAHGIPGGIKRSTEWIIRKGLGMWLVCLHVEYDAWFGTLQ